ncbi:uncharacterized protein TNCV_1476891 [Trichonephila clavipes]|nr:uncharacterized protein TNCV_1476891 [Trichonephila clavipes]
MASTITRSVSLRFFLWGFLKGLVYETPVATPEDLVGRIVEAAGCVEDTSGIFEKMRCSMQRRCQTCLDASGKNFEHLLVPGPSSQCGSVHYVTLHQPSTQRVYRGTRTRLHKSSTITRSCDYDYSTTADTNDEFLKRQTQAATEFNH